MRLNLKLPVVRPHNKTDIAMGCARVLVISGENPWNLAADFFIMLQNMLLATSYKLFQVNPYMSFLY
jgi:hypothetical protein